MNTYYYKTTTLHQMKRNGPVFCREGPVSCFKIKQNIPIKLSLIILTSFIFLLRLHQSYPPNVMHLLKSKKKMNEQQLLSLAGPAITNFCRGYSSYQAYPTKPGNTRSRSVSIYWISVVKCFRFNPPLSLSRSHLKIN